MGCSWMDGGVVLVVGQDQDQDQDQEEEEEEKGLDIGMEKMQSVCGRKRLGRVLPVR